MQKASRLMQNWHEQCGRGEHPVQRRRFLSLVSTLLENDSSHFGSKAFLTQPPLKGETGGRSFGAVPACLPVCLSLFTAGFLC